MLAISVFLIVIFLLANFTGAVLVLISVMFTIADVMGFMYFWGLTIDSTSCMLLIICIGLSVDYSAHIAHGFLHQTASSDITCREERLNIRSAQCTVGLQAGHFFNAFLHQQNTNPPYQEHT